MLEIYTERDNTRRRRSRKFALSVIASGYQSYMTASAELQKENVIANQIIEEAALDSTEEEIFKQFSGFRKYLSIYADLDERAFLIYRSSSPDDSEEVSADVVSAEGETDPQIVPASQNWLATENVIMAFFAAIAQFSTSEAKAVRVDEALTALLRLLRSPEAGADPMGLGVFERLKGGNNPRRTNVGLATRKLLTNGFKEFFRDSGETSLATCWQLGAE